MTILYPKIAQLRNLVRRRDRSSGVRAAVMALLGLLFWAAVFLLCYRILAYFRGIDVVGAFLAARLLSMVLLVFFSVLVFSNIITALSVFFISEELQLVAATPYDVDELYLSKTAESLVNSSWMVVLFSLPVFVSYGVVFGQGVLYYAASVMALLPLYLIAGMLGTAIAFVLVRSFPACRLRDVFVLLALFLFVGLYSMFRFMQPERLLDPDGFFTVIDYLSSLSAPTSPLLPNQWAADALSFFLFQRPAPDAALAFACLWTTALALIVLIGWWFRGMYFSAWSRAQEAKTIRITHRPVFKKALDLLLAGCSPALKGVIGKDIRCFFRDTAQWSQLFILVAIIAIYLYNFSVLPLDKSPIPTKQLQNIISFLNLGLAGFVLTAVAVRLGYPAVSLEGESFWIVKSSPVGLGRLIRGKFIVNFLLLAVLALVLVVCTNMLLDAEPLFMTLSTVTAVCLALGICGLAIGIGAAYPRFRFENIAQIPTGFGGLVFMMLSMVLCVAVVSLEALPMQLFMHAAGPGHHLSARELLMTAACYGTALLLCVAAAVLPVLFGLRRLSRIESF
jgi:ABC-2 type transport system permease protein